MSTAHDVLFPGESDLHLVEPDPLDCPPDCPGGCERCLAEDSDDTCEGFDVSQAELDAFARRNPIFARLVVDWADVADEPTRDLDAMPLLH